MQRVTGPASVVAGALGAVVVLETLRVFLASTVFIYGVTGETSAVSLGLFAIAPYLAAAIAIPFVARFGDRLGWSAAVVLVAARTVLQFASGGQLQLWSSLLGVAAGLVWLLSLVRVGPPAAFGLVLGFAADATLHVVLRSTDLAWRGGLFAWFATIALLLAFVGAARRARADATDTSAPAWPWLILGPLFTLHGIVAGVPSRLLSISGWAESFVVVIVLAGQAAVIVAAPWALARRDKTPALLAAAATIAGTALAVVVGTPPLVALGHLVLPAGLAMAVVAATAADGDSSAGRRALVAWFGLLVFFVLSFGYYLPYDVAVSIPNEVFLGIGALLAGGLALAASSDAVGRVAYPLPRPKPPTRRLAGFIVLIGLLIAWRSPNLRAIEPADPRTLRVMTYNLHMGYDTDGRYGPVALARIIADERPDVVALQEVSRGWLINGDVDVLPLIAERLGMPYVFAPAADESWGNAILSRYPIVEQHDELLPQGDSAMRRGVVAVTVDLGASELVVVGTHLHHVEEDSDVRRLQAERVAEVVAEFAGDREVVVMGDLNAETGADELEPLEAAFDNLTAELGPNATYPAADPVEAIDHILVTDGLTGADLVVPESTASDHLGVAVTLELPRAAGDG